MTASQPDQGPLFDRTRTWIALAIVALGAMGIVVISWVALDKTDNSAETSRLIFASVLPLLGTWVGAVLAFYFTRDNLQAGSETALRAMRSLTGPSPETPVTEIMIPVNRINPIRLVQDEPAARTLTLASLYQNMKAAGQSRVPVFDQGQVAILVVHEPDLDKYAQKKGLSAAALTETIDDLLKDQEIGPELTAFVTVAPSVTLADARTELGKMLHAKDLFITENGQRTSKVIGWLTNSDLARAS